MYSFDSDALKWNLHELVFITHSEIIGGHETKDQRNRDKEASGQHFFSKKTDFSKKSDKFSKLSEMVSSSATIRCYLMNKSS